MYAERPLAYAPTPYSYTPTSTLSATINLDEVSRTRCYPITPYPANKQSRKSSLQATAQNEICSNLWPRYTAS